MKYALLNDEKVEALESGTIALCPICKGSVRAKCGEKKINHWAHISKQECDSWQDNETEWHRNWKNYFPAEWQEVVMFDAETGEKHVADIRTRNNVVIEFQNSPIFPAEVRQREGFYRRLIWVVNAQNSRNSLEYAAK